MTQEEIYNLVDKYLNGAMASEEKKSFEQKCETDSQFREAVQLQTQARHAALISAETDLKNRLDAQFDSLNASLAEQEGNKISMKRWFIAAAAIILLLVSMPFLLKEAVPQTPEEIYETYIDFPLPPSSRSNTPEDLKWREAIAAYYKGDFQKAIQSLKVFLQTPEGQEIAPRVHFFLGLSYLQIDEPDLALSELDKVNKESIYRPYILWYQAITHLKKGEKGKAVTLFKKIQQLPNHFKTKEAKEILAILVDGE